MKLSKSKRVTKIAAKKSEALQADDKIMLAEFLHKLKLLKVMVTVDAGQVAQSSIHQTLRFTIKGDLGKGKLGKRSMEMSIEIKEGSHPMHY